MRTLVVHQSSGLLERTTGVDGIRAEDRDGLAVEHGNQLAKPAGPARALPEEDEPVDPRADVDHVGHGQFVEIDVGDRSDAHVVTGSCG